MIHGGNGCEGGAVASVMEKLEKTLSIAEGVPGYTSQTNMDRRKTYRCVRELVAYIKLELDATTAACTKMIRQKTCKRFTRPEGMAN